MALVSDNILPLLGLNPSGDLGPYTIYRTARRGVVWFGRSPPKRPASYLQRRHRNKWRFAARVWSATPLSDRANWNLVASLAGLTISGYNLFVWYQVIKDRSIIETLERRTGIDLL